MEDMCNVRTSKKTITARTVVGPFRYSDDFSVFSCLVFVKLEGYSRLLRNYKSGKSLLL